jgi:TRAP-type C4-dicarboxylate transport system permease small subunit
MKKLADTIGLVLFACLFGVFVLQVAARFGFNRPLPWTDELAVVLYLWAILWAAAFMVPEREHVAFDLLTNLLKARTQRFTTALGTLTVGALAAWALPATWDYVRFMAREGTPVLGLPFMAVFMPFVFLMLVLVWRGLKAVRMLFEEIAR